MAKIKELEARRDELLKKSKELTAEVEQKQQALDVSSVLLISSFTRDLSGSDLSGKHRM